jgi:hypothetical protein
MLNDYTPVAAKRFGRSDRNRVIAAFVTFSLGKSGAHGRTSSGGGGRDRSK